MRCADCTNGFNDPQPTAEEAHVFFARSYHEGGDPQLWDGAQMRPVFAQYLRVVGAYARTCAGAQSARLLDAGCGTGQFLVEARRAGYDAVGVETSVSAVEHARRKHGLAVQLATLEDAPLEAGSCDAVTAWKVLDHVSEPVTFLQRALELLRPGGVFAASVSNFEFHRRMELAWRRIGSPKWCRPPTVFHNFSFSAPGLRCLLERVGYSSVRIRHAPLDPRVPAVVRLVGTRLEPWVRRGVYATAQAIRYATGARCWLGPSIMVLAQRPQSTAGFGRRNGI
jgi:SAM-dependent methyltransferase